MKKEHKIAGESDMLITKKIIIINSRYRYVMWHCEISRIFDVVFGG